MNAPVVPIFLSLMLLAGCCAAPNLDFVLEPRDVTIITEPAGAQVMQLQPLEQPPVVLGTTPLEGVTVTVMNHVCMADLAAPKTQELLRYAGTVVVQITKPGYQTFEGALRTDPRRPVTHRIVLQPIPAAVANP